MTDPKRLLDSVNGPRDLHGLDDSQLQQVAQEVREHIIDTVGEIGGHFGANLGTCEIAVAIHSLLDSPRDKVLWDVGHQAYPHKILTGRRDQLSTIRSYGGLSPFCSIEESEHDAMGAGHASTSIGYGVGMKEGMKRAQVEGLPVADGRVVAVIGDGAMTGGVAFEAIHQAGGLGTPLVVVLNDNGMSISPNVGAMSRYFNRIRLNPKLWHAREGIEGGLSKLPAGIGATFERLGPHLKESIKAFAAPGLWWEELDWAYVGVVDGHDVHSLRAALKEALDADRPVVVHCATVKGKGFAPAEDGGLEGMEQWHAAKPNSIVDRAPAAKKAPTGPATTPVPTWTEVFGHAMVNECRRDPRVVGVTAAMNSGTGLNILQEEMPERYFDVGIAEQQALLFAAGLSLEGTRPVVAIYSTFLQRGFDQIVHDLCLQSLPVVIAMDRAGLVGDDGPTHHGVFDIAYLRALPNITLMAPRDEAMLLNMLHTAINHDGGPVGIRYPRGAAAGVTIPAQPERIEIGTGEILIQGERVAFVGYGSGVEKSLAAAEILREGGLNPTVVDARFAKPIDAGLMAQIAAEHDLVVTVEEGVLQGGFGGAVLETLNDAGVVARVLRVGLPDRFVTHGAPALLHQEVGYTPERIAERVEAAVSDARGSLAGS
ncbi:MAG: 1-deoxy-D-xylulose-5-phosphate synthase [Actinomycetes bacterium]